MFETLCPCAREKQDGALAVFCLFKMIKNRTKQKHQTTAVDRSEKHCYPFHVGSRPAQSGSGTPPVEWSGTLQYAGPIVK